MRYFAVLLAVLSTVAPAFGNPTPAATSDCGSTLDVVGQGILTRQPDMAQINVSLVTNADSADKAMSANNAKYETLKSRVRALGMSDGDVKTTSLNVNYFPRPFPQPLPMSNGASVGPTPSPAASAGIAQPAPGYPYWQPQLSGYVATRSVAITTKKPDNAASIIDAVSASGINAVNVQFSLQNQRALYLEAVSLAMKDAKQEARALTSSGDLRLGAIKSVRIEPTYGYVQPMMGNAIRFPATIPPVPTEITPQDITVRASVTVTYYIK